MKRKLVIIVLVILSVTALPSFANNIPSVQPSGDSVILNLPQGFSARLIAANVGAARHIAVTKQGNIYVKLGKLKDGKGIYYLIDTDGDGKIDRQTAFGDYAGTGIAIKDGYLYASSNDAVYRYRLNEKEEVINPDAPEKIITGLVNRNRDNSKSIALDNKGNIYVNVGSYINACLLEPNATKAPNPCPLLDSIGGIWQFKINKLNQAYSDGVHYATGLKNVVGLDWNTQTKSLFVMQHGRDQLHDLYPQYYTVEQNGVQPAETMYELHKGSDAGWPYMYYDPILKQYMLSPEYGGDGKTVATRKAQLPDMVFPAHLAPNGLLFYTGNSFPQKYKSGAFIAFHGLSPQLQKGYLVAFVPFKKGKPSGDWEVFADGFAGISDFKSGAKAQQRPCGLAIGPDGAIYVSDDSKGAIYRITYTGK